MPEDVERAPADRRAVWVGMRTLRQRPTVVGQTAAGEAIYEVRSIPLVLAPGSAHFNRLVQCNKCGLEIAGPPVLTPTDLDRPANRMFCASCVRTPRQREGVTPSPAAWPPGPADLVETARDDGSAVDARLAEVEAQLAAVVQRLDALAAVDTRSLAAALSEAQADIRKLAVLQEDCTRVVVHLSERLDHPPATDIDATLEHRLEEARVATAGIIAAERQQLQAALTEGLDAVRAEIASRELDQPAALAGLLEAQRRDVEAALHDVARQTVTAVAVPLKDLTDSREEVMGRLGALAEALDLARTQVASLEERIDGLSSSAQAERQEAERVPIEAAREALAAVGAPLRDLTLARQELEHRLELLAEWADAGDARQHVLEQRLNDCAERITVIAEHQAAQMAPPPAPVRPPGELLESLERQLREAEERIAQR